MAIGEHIQKKRLRRTRGKHLEKQEEQDYPRTGGALWGLMSV